MAVCSSLSIQPLLLLLEKSTLVYINVCAAASLNEIYIKLGEITILYIGAPSRKHPIDLIDCAAVLYKALMPADCAWAEKCVRHIMCYIDIENALLLAVYIYFS